MTNRLKKFCTQILTISKYKEILCGGNQVKHFEKISVKVSPGGSSTPLRPHAPPQPLGSLGSQSDSEPCSPCSPSLSLTPLSPVSPWGLRGLRKPWGLSETQGLTPPCPFATPHPGPPLQCLWGLRKP